jgi:hypothetical protein
MKCISLPLFGRPEKHWGLQMPHRRLESGTSQGRIRSQALPPCSHAIVSRSAWKMFLLPLRETEKPRRIPDVSAKTRNLYTWQSCRWDDNVNIILDELDWAGSGKDPMPTFCGHAMLKNFRLFTDRKLRSQLSNYQLLKEHPQPRSLSSVPTYVTSVILEITTSTWLLETDCCKQAWK